jgi:two-component system KDP operon response regulator KdpE
MKVLIVEDDPDVVEAVSLVFKMHWPKAELLTTSLGQEGIDLAGSDQLDLIILDLGLSDMSGFEVLKKVRAFSTVPIIVLTVKQDEIDIAKGLEWGADDYVTKPYKPLELVARIRTRLRDRESGIHGEPLSFGPLHLDLSRRHLTCGEREITLTGLETHILGHLMHKKGGLALYGNLAEDVWGVEYPGCIDSLRVYIRRLREKIERDPGHPEIILTKSGVGYYLNRT